MARVKHAAVKNAQKSTKGVILEREVLLDELTHLRFSDKIVSRGWESLLTKLIPPSEEVVKYFFLRTIFLACHPTDLQLTLSKVLNDVATICKHLNVVGTQGASSMVGGVEDPDLSDSPLDDEDNELSASAATVHSPSDVDDSA
ncbi:hypothetical protein CJ030_MR8G003119 [Morella rubra]|uniref:Uncharacterized protein n=1 Tax=Morella rubra TaxID=262757 RepID=A0A6A1UT42_9ROSI|nr:hypothetical protein CJ030_MR8G003119 [Morella rubra]